MAALLGMLGLAVPDASRAARRQAPRENPFASSIELQAGSFTRWLTDGVDDGVTKGELYAEPKFKFGEAVGPPWLVVSGRARGFLEPQLRDSRFEIRDSYLNFENATLRARAGFQSLSWGETFGFFIADLPNPREWRDPLLLELAFTKKPVFMFSGQWFCSLGTLEAFFTPVTRSSDFQQDLDVPVPGRRELGRVGRDSEAGVRLSHLWGFGLDSSIFAISHLDREAPLEPARRLSVGATASQALGTDWVLRTDQVFRMNASFPEWQGVLGADWNPSGSFTLGAQLQADRREFMERWGSSLRAQWRGLDDRWDLEAFIFQGWDVGETWIQPRISYNHPNGVSASLRYDWIDAPALGQGFLAGAPQLDRLVLWLAYRI